MLKANRYGVLAVFLAFILLALCAPESAVNADTQEEPVEPSRRVEPPQRHGRHEGFEGFERFNAFAQRLRTRAKEEEEDLAELIELVRAWRMTKEVGLSEEEALKMLRLGREMKQQSGQVAQQRKRVMLGLKKLLEDPNAEDETIKRELQKLDRLDERQRRIAREYEQRMGAGLTVRQQAKMRLFKARFEGDMRRVIEYVRRQHAGAMRDGPRPGKQPPPEGPPRGPHQRKQRAEEPAPTAPTE